MLPSPVTSVVVLSFSLRACLSSRRRCLFHRIQAPLTSRALDDGNDAAPPHLCLCARATATQNFYEHIHKLLAGKPPSLWRTCATMWWKICKNSDSRFAVEEPKGELPKPGTFVESWAVLEAFIKLHVEESENLTHELAWLATMAGKKRQWAACYCWSVLAYGVHSTQRIEAIHSAVAQWCRKSMLLLAFFEELESHEELRCEKGDTKAHRLALQLAAKNMKVWPPVYKVRQKRTATHRNRAFLTAVEFYYYFF